MTLRVAFIWHQHQPYYKDGNRYLLPWTRLHATKDYYDIAAALQAYPGLRQTINVAPSLLLQLIDYCEHNATDVALELSRRPAAELNDDEKVEILRSFFLCNVERMILPYERYAELYRNGNRDRNDIAGLAAAAAAFTTQDWLDLQVWYNLTWIGEYSRSHEPFASLLGKGRDFTEEEKHSLLDAAGEIVASVVPTYRSLLESGQAELSVTPFYHPILPLLCDSRSALEATPETPLPNHHISYPEDARAQIQRGAKLFADLFGRRPHGMWPSEGSVSDAAMALASEAGFEWAATDEEILRGTLGEGWHDLATYFPHQLTTPFGKLWMLFRDHELSDAIGFVYSGWDPDAAAHDFYNRLLHIRSRIVEELGEEHLRYALVPVILDGENCWEFYLHNGRPFLEALYRLLSESQEIGTTTVHDALAGATAGDARHLHHLRAGSWVGGTFKIWIGHEEDNRAWDALAEAREALLAAHGRLSPDAFAAGMEEIYIAEGSDWFWWFGDENMASNRDDFDALFRMHLREVYRIIGTEPPEHLSDPIMQSGRVSRVVSQGSRISPAMDGARASSGTWQGAGWFSMKEAGGAMHRASVSERRILFGTDGTRLYVRFDTWAQVSKDQEIRVIVSGTRSITIRGSHARVGVEHQWNGARSVHLDGVAVAQLETMDIALPLALLFDEAHRPGAVGMRCELYDGGRLTESMPAQGTLLCQLVAE
ncbi:MAG: glycoside hydrolase [Bacteroidetes bacterium]|nr:glycoside hydrolase [Bacteroidota bacterium]